MEEDKQIEDSGSVVLIAEENSKKKIRKKRSKKFWVLTSLGALGSLLFFIPLIFPYLMSHSTGIPYYEILMAGGSLPEWDIEYIFTYGDFVMAFAFMLLPPVGFLIAGFLKGLPGLIAMLIGASLLIVVLFVYRVYQYPVELRLYLIFNGIALAIPFSLKIAEFIFMLCKKELGLKGKALVYVAPFILVIGVYAIMIVLAIIIMLIIFAAIVVVSVGVFLTLGAVQNANPMGLEPPGAKYKLSDGTTVTEYCGHYRAENGDRYEKSSWDGRFIKK